MAPFPRGQNRRLRSLRKLDCVAPCPRGENPADDFAHLRSSLFTTSLAGKLYEQLSKCADEGVERKAHDMSAGWDHHGTEDRIGFQDLSLHSIYARPPPRMPDVVEEKNGRHGSVDCDHHLRVPVVQQASGTALARGINPRQSCGCML